ncbi:hypothetical protein D3C76_1428810 [compost metagenome]
MAHTDKAVCLALHLIGIRTKRPGQPFPLLGAVIGIGQLAVKGKNEQKGQLRHTYSIAAGNIGNGNAPVGCCL